MYAHITAYKAHTQATLRKQLGGAQHDKVHMKQRQHGWGEILSAGNKVKDQSKAAFMLSPELIAVLNDNQDDGGVVDQEVIELVAGNDDATVIDNVMYNVRHCKRHRKVIKSDSQTATEYTVDGQKLGYSALIEDASYQRIIKGRTYHGIEDIVLTTKGTVRVGQGKGKRRTRAQILAEAKAKLNK